MRASPARRSTSSRSAAKSAAAAPAASAHPYFVLLDAMADGAVLLKPDGEILFANRSFVTMAGASLDTLRGTPIQRIASRADGAALDAFLLEGHLDRTAREFVLTPTARPAVAVAITLTSLPREVPLSSLAGTSRALLAIVTDLTHRNAAEAARRDLMKRLISAEADERRRIARELHDETGQSLTALLVGLRAIAQMTGRPEVHEAAMRLRDVAAQTIDDVGRLARGLHPAVLDDKGLGAAARRYATDYVGLYGTAVEFTGGAVDSPRLPPLTAATMFRILQETLTNVARHSDATRVRVQLTRGPSTLTLVVVDNGVGFDVPSATDAQTGLGLSGMQERVTLLGGALRIASTSGHGTEVHVRLPLVPRPARARQERTMPTREQP
jgi:signal transduction histidine kinase